MLLGWSVQGSKMRFLDTMSLHMAIAGLTGFQRSLWMASKYGKRKGLQEVKEHMKRLGRRSEGPKVRTNLATFVSSALIVCNTTNR